MIINFDMNDNCKEIGINMDYIEQKTLLKLINQITIFCTEGKWYQLSMPIIVYLLLLYIHVVVLFLQVIIVFKSWQKLLTTVNTTQNSVKSNIFKIKKKQKKLFIGLIILIINQKNPKLIIRLTHTGKSLLFCDMTHYLTTII